MEYDLVSNEIVRMKYGIDRKLSNLKIGPKMV